MYVGADIKCPIDGSEAADVASDFPLLFPYDKESHLSAKCAAASHMLHVHVERRETGETMSINIWEKSYAAQEG
jgi:hypothetical protein